MFSGGVPVVKAVHSVPTEVWTTSVEESAMMTAHRMTPTVSMRVRPTGYRGSSRAIALQPDARILSC